MDLSSVGDFSVSAPTSDEPCFGWKLASNVPQPPISTLGTRPMAPQNRPPPRRADTLLVAADSQSVQDTAQNNDELFLDPMLGTPLAIYIEKDVHDRDNLVEIITKHGGTVSPGYSGVPYILVDPHKESGQSLYRQYAGKKGKIVLDARWVHECVRAGALQTFHENWAGCKVTGTEQVGAHIDAQPSVPPPTRTPSAPRKGRPPKQTPTPGFHVQPSQPMQAPPSAVIQPSTTTLAGPPPPPAALQYPVFHGRAMQPPTSAPPQSWQAPNGIAPHQAHIAHPHSQMLSRPPPNPYGRDDGWQESAFHPMATPDGAMGSLNDGQPPAGYYDQRFRDGQHTWAPTPNTQAYYDQQPYEQPYAQMEPYLPLPGPSTTEQPAQQVASQDKQRGRKRTRNTALTTQLLVTRPKNPDARSPTPPTRVIKSTYGGNLFTADDVLYLKRYIDYCQEQGLVLSLREICERIAVKAPHHTFYSWRRYCNKHQIRLGGYAMGSRSPSPEGDQQENGEQSGSQPPPGGGPMTVAAAARMMQENGVMRTRSPTPPRALFRSTTGKGVAFTNEDVSYLCKYLAYRKIQGRLDMVTFWKDVAAKAPHHSRASWMKYYRRHKHELNRVDGDEPLPPAPAKKMRYGRNDDILLARYFATKPEGTSDKIFQNFARIYPHHPWKGWQEHHRIHKAKIDHLIQRINQGEQIELVSEED